MLALTSDSRDFNVTSSLAATDSIATLNRHKNALQIGFVQTRNFVDQELRQASRLFHLAPEGLHRHRIAPIYTQHRARDGATNPRVSSTSVRSKHQA